MSRPTRHPSGPTIARTIRFAPAHLERLDEHAAARDTSRSELLGKLIERAFSSAPPEPEPEDPDPIVQFLNDVGRATQRLRQRLEASR